jgi:hypothetical protein
VMIGWLSRKRQGWDQATAANVLVWGLVAIVIATGVVFGGAVEAGWDGARAPRIALAAELVKLGVPADDRILSIDAGGIKYWTGHPGVVTPDDPIETIQAVAQAYQTRWLVIERDNAARSLGPVLAGTRPAWIGPPVFTVPAADGGLPTLALFPVCTTPGDTRCGSG